MWCGNQVSLCANRALLLLLLAVPALPVPAQTSTDDVHVVPRVLTASSRSINPIDIPDGRNPTLRVDVNLVLVPVTITDGMNRLVQGLGRDAFRVLEEKKEQQIRYFSSEDSPVSLGIILDVSGSMKNKLDSAHQAVDKFLDESNPDDEFFLITFSDKPEIASDFTQHREDIQNKLLYSVPKGRTALLDAIYLGVAKLQQAKNQRKALLIISDGGDNHSRYTENQVISLIKEADVMIYGIGIYTDYFPTREESLGPELLRRISEVTGGASFVIGDPNDLVDAAKSVGMMLRNQYLLGYRPAMIRKDGKWHKIKIVFNRSKQLKLPGAFRVYARSGYYAASE